MCLTLILELGKPYSVSCSVVSSKFQSLVNLIQCDRVYKALNFKCHRNFNKPEFDRNYFMENCMANGHAENDRKIKSENDLSAICRNLSQKTYKVGFYPKSNAGKCPNKMAKQENIRNIKACTLHTLFQWPCLDGKIAEFSCPIR